MYTGAAHATRTSQRRRWIWTVTHPHMLRNNNNIVLGSAWEQFHRQTSTGYCTHRMRQPDEAHEKLSLYKIFVTLHWVSGVQQSSEMLTSTLNSEHQIKYTDCTQYNTHAWNVRSSFALHSAHTNVEAFNYKALLLLEIFQKLWLQCPPHKVPNTRRGRCRMWSVDPTRY